MSEPIHDKSTIEYLKTAVRYLASGFVTIVAFIVLKNDAPISFPKDDQIWYALILAGIIGLLIYSFHAAIGDDFLYKYALKKVLKDWRKSRDLPCHFTDPDNLKNSMFTLTQYRYMREGTTNPKHQAIQRRLDQELTFLVFLYASSYPLLLLPIYKLVYIWIDKKSVFSEEFDFVSLLSFLFGLALLWSGHVLDRKLTAWEIWFLDNFQTRIISRDEVLEKIIRESFGVTDDSQVKIKLGLIKKQIESSEKCDEILYPANH